MFHQLPFLGYWPITCYSLFIVYKPIVCYSLLLFLAVKGHFLYLPVTFSTAVTCADFTTSYLITRGKCLQISYLAINDKIWGSIDVYLNDENLEKEFVGNIVFTGLPKLVANRWQSWIIRLPDRDGLRQVVIKGIRTANQYTGMAIDDLSIRPCSDYSEFFKSFVL